MDGRQSASIAGASKHPHLTPQSISGQLGELEESLGVERFPRSDRCNTHSTQIQPNVPGLQSNQPQFP